MLRAMGASSKAKRAREPKQTAPKPNRFRPPASFRRSIRPRKQRGLIEISVG